MLITRSALLFLLAAVAEIGGGYLIWLWLRRNESLLLGLIGGAVLFVYGVIPTFQPAHFGRVYAAYGGVFVVMALVWGWLVDKRAADWHDVAGAALVVMGVGVIMYWPRDVQ
jgi:small multidrug resistance family-3 protein